MLVPIILSDYVSTYGNDWADVLPDNCPPEKVFISNEDVFFRFIKNPDYVVEDDWKSYLVLKPNNSYSAEKRILAAGLSLYNDLQTATDKLKLHLFRNKFKGLVRLSLIPEDGVVLQTFSDIHHYTWWRTNKCNLAKAQLVCELL